MAQKPSLPKGTRDFGPAQMLKRNYILDAIRAVFRKYGFLPLETPAMENLSTLTGKYGDEGDQLLFRILNSGDYLSKTQVSDYTTGSKALTGKIAEKGLKYDLTVPFARYVVMNQHDIAFPFKRYQIQPVWRADRPQKGRYREFYQCDADIIGTNSLICEAELMCIVHEVFDKLNFSNFSVSISNRKVLEGMAEVLNASEQFSTFCVILDKLDKIGQDRVFDELGKIGIETEALNQLDTMLNLPGTNTNKLEALKELFHNSETGLTGVKELEDTFGYINKLGLTEHNLFFDPTLARGLSYYTGTIYEVKPTSIKMGTITAGGRYDNLTGIFGLKDVSGVGISFGIDRIYDTLEELNLFPNENEETTQVLITNFDTESADYALGLLAQLRKVNINSEFYPDSTKLKKQMSYADKKGIPFCLMVGSREIETGEFILKNMSTGEQKSLEFDAIIEELSGI
ncbi:MAG: histidine--tRNA ligase [Roseivirga sp.]|nr:histidine--tRNA ligase [Roseivirga sp.]